MKLFKVVYYKHNTKLKRYTIVSANDEKQAVEHCFSCAFVSGNREDLISVTEVENMNNER